MSFLTILGTAAVVSAAIFMELIACLAFPVESGTEWLLLLLLVPLVLAAIPLLLLRACAGDSLFSDTPKGRHWAEFGFAFFATGIIGVPSLLLLRGLIRCRQTTPDPPPSMSPVKILDDCGLPQVGGLRPRPRRPRPARHHCRPFQGVPARRLRPLQLSVARDPLSTTSERASAVPWPARRVLRPC